MTLMASSAHQSLPASITHQPADILAEEAANIKILLAILDASQDFSVLRRSANAKFHEGEPTYATVWEELPRLVSLGSQISHVKAHST